MNPLNYSTIKDITIDPENPFSNDRLDRRLVAENLTKLLSTISESLVLAINSPWGTGKTTFIKMWELYLRKEGYSCLYFNAWENDFSNEPLITLIGEIQQSIDEGKISSQDSSKYNKYLTQAKRLSGFLLQRATPLVVRIATQGLINIDQATEKEIARFMSDLAEDSIEDYLAKKDNLFRFKQNLENLIEEISSEEKSKSPLVFIIDELDRCRPLYAIELLESVKHLFSVNGIIFVLVLDMDQLSHSVKTLYGVEMNAEGYLRRFIDLEFNLPNPSAEKFCDFLIDSLNLSAVFEKRENPRELNYLRNTISKLADLYSIDLRTQIRIVTRINIIVRIIEFNQPLFPECLAFLVILKTCRSTIYNKIINLEYSRAQDIFDLITNEGIPLSNQLFMNVTGQIIRVSITNMFVREIDIQKENETINANFTKMKLFGEDRDQATHFLNQINSRDFLESYKMNIVEYLIQFIEFSKDFNLGDLDHTPVNG